MRRTIEYLYSYQLLKHRITLLKYFPAFALAQWFFTSGTLVRMSSEELQLNSEPINPETFMFDNKIFINLKHLPWG